MTEPTNPAPTLTLVPQAAPDLPVHVTPALSPFASGWYAGEVAADEPRNALAIDLDVDVCVIGAGLAGLTAAREIARRGWSVVVLEAERVGAAASGRNSGFVMPGFGEDVTRIVERVGEEHARRLWALSAEGLAYVRRAAADLNLPSVEASGGWLRVSRTDRDRELIALAERMNAFGTKAEFWSRERVRGELPTQRYFGAVNFPDAFSINPLAYTLALARDAERAGVRIFENTPAVAIDPAGIRKRITAPSARVRASQVVLAGSQSLGPLMPRLSSTLVPVTSYVVVTEPIGPVLRETLRYRGAVSDDFGDERHYRIVGDDRLMWAGRATTKARNAQSLARALVRDIKRTFPQLGDVKAAHAWSGTFGLPIHGMPQIGELARGVWVASGFAAHGLNTTAMAGDLIARGMTEHDQTWRVFAPYELVWAGGSFGRGVTSTLLFGRRPVAALRSAWSRYRERAAARRQQRKAARAEALARRREEQEAARRVAAYQAAAQQAAVVKVEPPPPAPEVTAPIADSVATPAEPAAERADAAVESPVIPVADPANYAPVPVAAASAPLAEPPNKGGKRKTVAKSGKRRAKKPQRPKGGT